MKKLLIVFAFVVIGSGAFAQASKTKPKTQPQPVAKEVVNQPVATDAYYTRMEGKVVIVKGAESRPMENDMMKFDNGNYITREGVFVYNNGTQKMMLEEGMKVDTKGNIMGRAVQMDAVPTPDKPVKAAPADAK